MPDRISKGLAKKYPEGFCPHSVRVCIKCGKFEGYGSHGKLSVIPDNCKKEVNYLLKRK